MGDDRYPMISVEEAQERIRSYVRPLNSVETPLLDAVDRVLAEDVR
jgi:molybdopterin biosynthesis enzyme